MKKNENNGRVIHELTHELLEWLRSKSYCDRHVSRHRQIAHNVSEYMIARGIIGYTPEVGYAFLENYFSKRKISSQSKDRVRMVVSRLNDFCMERKPPSRTTDAPNREPLAGQFSTVLDAYLDWCAANGSKPSTIRAKSDFCGAFLRNLVDLGCGSIDRMNPEQVGRACLMFQNRNAWSHVRMFLRYLYGTSLVACDYSSIVPSYRRPVVLPSVYAEDDMRRLEEAVDLTSRSGIRDYAMLLLVTRYGLRAGDIVKLSFKELDFERGKIRLTQEKTGKPWEAAMLPEIRAALLNYIDNARPRVDTDTVFLLVRAPFHGVGNSSVRDALSRYFAKAGIAPKGRKRGPHAFRSSLASSMVNDNVPYEVVRRVLGHDDPNAVKHYAKIDIERLREYAIPVPEAAGIFARFLGGEVQA